MDMGGGKHSVYLLCYPARKSKWIFLPMHYFSAWLSYADIFHTVSPISSEKSSSTGGLSNVEWQIQVFQNPICVQKLQFIINNKYCQSFSLNFQACLVHFGKKKSATSLV